MMTWHWLLIPLSFAPLAQEVAPPPQGSQGPSQEQAREELIKLFGEVETRLKEIDELLFDASAGGRGLAGGEATVIGQLLEETAGRSDQVLEGIDQILEIADKFGKGQGSSSGGSSVQEAMQGQSPLDQQSSGQPSGQRESTPELGGQKGEQPGSNQETPGAQQPPQQPGQEEQPKPGEQPGDSPADSQAQPENRDSDQDPLSGATGRVQVTDTAERWGDLPVHVRDLFRSEGGRDMPPEYRDWIDSYYRRLNRRP